MVRAVVAFRDRGDTDLAEAAAILEDVTADQLEAVLMVALGLAVQLGVAPVCAVFGEHPVQGADSRDGEHGSL